VSHGAVVNALGKNDSIKLRPILRRSRERVNSKRPQFSCPITSEASMSTKPFASSPRGLQRPPKKLTMKTMSERLSTRLLRDRPMTTISLRMPADVIDDLKEIALMLGFSGYQPLMRSYIGQCLREDLQRLDGSQVDALTRSLRKQGIAEGRSPSSSQKPA
jgi:hypothetical protein